MEYIQAVCNLNTYTLYKIYNDQRREQIVVSQYFKNEYTSSYGVNV